MGGSPTAGRRSGLVHGDYRLDNMLFGAQDAPRRFVAVDWQTVGWGPVMTDASYFLGSSLTVEDRRANEEALVREYYDALHAHGVRGFDWEQCWLGYRRRVLPRSTDDGRAGGARRAHRARR